MSLYYDQVTALAPALWYKFNEASGTPANSGSLTQTLTGTGTPSLNQAGIQQKCVAFNGTSQYYSFSALTSNTLFNDSTYSIEFWFKSTDANGTIYSIFNSIGGTINSTIVALESGKIRFYAADPNNSGGNTLLTSATYNDGNWHHVVCTVVSTGTMKIYVDGGLVSSTTRSAFPTNTIDNGSYGRAIGVRKSQTGSLTDYYAGSLDELAVYNTVLTSTQVYDNYIAGFNTIYAATPMTASAAMPKVLAVHDVLYNLAVQDGAVYGMKLNSDLTDNYQVAGHTFTYTLNGGTYLPGQSPSITGGSWQFGSGTSSRSLSWNESTTPSFDNMKGLTLEFVFKLDAQVNNSNYKVLFNKGWSGGSLAAFLNANGSGGNNLGFQLNYNDYYVFNTVDLTPGNWYHIICEWGAKDDKITAYINGTKYQSTSSYTGSQNNWNDTNSFNIGCENISMDFIAIYATDYNASSYLTDDDVTIHYAAFQNGLIDMFNPIVFADSMNATGLMVNPSQSLGISVEPFAVTASAEMVNPYAIYITMNQSEPMLAGPAEMTFPQNLGTVNVYAIPLEAFIAIVDPTVTAIDNELYLPQPMTASALMPPADWSHDSGLNASHMYAEASMVEPSIDIAGRVKANPMIALDDLPMPTISTESNARFEPQVMTAKALFAVPPAYKLLIDDPWYVLLYEQQATRDTQPNSAAYGSSLPNTSPTEPARGFMKLFEDVSANITIPNGLKLKSNLPNRLFKSDPASTDETVIELLPSKGSGSGFSTSYGEGNLIYYSPAPTVETGYYDNYERKAVKFKNIEFEIPEDIYGSDRPYSLEFNIKTDKNNQIMFRGYKRDYSNGYIDSGAIGLKDGKVYGMTVRRTSTNKDKAVHPNAIDTTGSKSYVLGRKNIADNQWHHVVVQSTSGRFQIWIDGVLDIQSQTNFGCRIKPFIIGSNNKDDAYQSNFLTSLFSYDGEAFITDGKAFEHYLASIKSEPIKVEPMLASATITQNTTATGNRGRALMLYFWPTRDNGYYYGASSQAYGQLQTLNDQGKWGYFDEDTFDNDLHTMDYIKQPPQQYYDWDVFPVDVNGYYVSDLVKPEAYGGESNIQINSFPQQGSEQGAQFKINKRGYFVDPVTDDRRYIDVFNDIDLSKFDAVFFRNYPDQSSELDSVAREEVVDSYFNIREKVIFKNFVDSLRKAVDSGLSLMVTNHQLAIDLGIISGYDEVPDMDDQLGLYESDPYSATLPQCQDVPITPEQKQIWVDTYKNNRMRVVNTIAGLTDDPSYIWSETAYRVGSDEVKWGDPDRVFNKYTYKSNGLTIGDEMVISDYSPKIGNSYGIKRTYIGVSPDKVKAGKVITTFGATVRKGSQAIDNPYKNYATTIAVSPGDVLNGTQCGGKIFVNFTERLSEGANHLRSRDNGQVDAIFDSVINQAYNEGNISLAYRDQLLNSPNNIDKQLRDGVITQSQYNSLAYWQSNGKYILLETSVINEDPLGLINDNKPGSRTSTVIKTRKRGTPTTSQVTSGGAFFTVSYSRQYPTLVIKTISMLTRGFRWLSERISISGEVQRPLALQASAEMLEPTVSADKIISTNAQVMLAMAYTPEIGLVPNAEISPLPMTAIAEITQYQKLRAAEPMVANATLRTNVKAITSSIDEVVVYVYHTDPILYIREDVIK